MTRPTWHWRTSRLLWRLRSQKTLLYPLRLYHERLPYMMVPAIYRINVGVVFQLGRHAWIMSWVYW